MSENQSCEEIINQLATAAYAQYPHKNEVVQGMTIASEIDHVAHRLLTWIKQSEARRAALSQIAGGSACQLSAAREVRHRMIELHDAGTSDAVPIRELAAVSA